MEWFLVILGIIALTMITSPGFWRLVFAIGGLASGFAMLASIIYFQILAALGFFILMCLLWTLAAAIAAGDQ